MTFANPNISSGKALPSYAWSEGLLFYVDSDDDDQGLYISNGSEWHKVGGGNTGGVPPSKPQPVYGSVDLENGTALVLNSAFKNDSLVILSYQRINGTPGILSIVNELPGVGFDVLSTSPSDFSKVVYQIVQPSPDDGSYI